MRAVQDWQPSKYIRRKDGSLRANPDYVLPGSRFFCQRAIEALEPQIREHASGRLLDCGCGDVPYFMLYRDACSEVTCIDWEASSHGARHVDRAVDLSGRLPFGAERFDSVLLADVLEHLPRPEDLLAELRRVLVPGGKLIGSAPFLYWLHELPHDHHRYTRYGIESRLADAGLDLLHLRAYGGYPDVLIDLICKQLLRRKWMATAVMPALETLARIAPYRRWSRESAAAFPLGYVFVALRPSS